MGKDERVQEIAFASLFQSVLLFPVVDMWIWVQSSLGEFFMVSTHSLVDGCLLPLDPVATRWVNLGPIKVNIFSWKFVLGRLHTRLNLSRRGMEIPSSCFSICYNGLDSINQLFFSCPVDMTLLEKTMDLWWLS